MVLVLNAVPVGLRGELTRWLMEVDSGVFVGNPSRRIREELWTKVKENVRDGRALLIYQARTEQRLRVETHRHHWEPVDCDGLTLMRRPLPGKSDGGSQGSGRRRTGWSSARAMQRSRYPSWKTGGRNRQSE